MARAIAKYVRMSPRKVRRIIDLIRGKDVVSAQNALRFMPHAAARVVEKVLKSAVSNSKQNENLDPNALRISKAYADGSVTLKRWRAMSRGRGFPVLKRTSHVTIEVSHDENLASRTTAQHKVTAMKKEPEIKEEVKTQKEIKAKETLSKKPKIEKKKETKKDKKQTKKDK